MKRVLSVVSPRHAGAVLAACLGVNAGAPSVRGDVLFDSFNPDGSFSQTEFLAVVSVVSFSSQSVLSRFAARISTQNAPFELDTVTIPISQSLSGLPPSLRIRLTEDRANQPGETIEVLSQNATFPQFGGAISATTFVSTQRPVLQASSHYWIVLDLVSPPSVPNFTTYSFSWHATSGGVQVPLRFQQMTGAPPQDPWPGDTSTAPIALRVNGTPAVPPSACCNRESGACAVLSTAQCLSVGLLPLAPGLACSPTTCEQACRADFNASGDVGVQDLFDYLAAFFAGCP